MTDLQQTKASSAVRAPKPLLLIGAAVVGMGALLAFLGAPGWFRFNSSPAVPPNPPTVRLISQSQYVNTLANIFGSDIAVKVRFAPVKRVNGLVAVGASTAVLTTGALDPLEATARAVAAQVVDPSHRSFLIPCEPRDPRAPDERCAKAFFARVGQLIYRRPLADAELSALAQLAGRAVDVSQDFYSGLSFALSGMLISPQFLYIVESVEPDPHRDGSWRLDAYSKAARLSFLLWNSSPDAELLSAAQRGDLHSRSGLERQLERMIASPLYVDGVRAFLTDFFVLEAFDTLAKDATIYPAFTLKVVEEAREQLLRSAADHLVTQRGDYRDLFVTRRIALSSDLGAVYRLPVDLGSQGWAFHDFQENDPRAGLLTQVGFLAQYAHPGRSSSTRRGRAIREVLLCQNVPDPPPNVDFSILEDADSRLRTARERLTVHQKNPTCAGCHALTDPIGLGLERFDGAGQYRATENDAPIDANGTLDGVAFADAAGLGRAVRDNPALKSCVIDRLYAYSIGQKAGKGQGPLLKYFEATLDKRGYRFDEMLKLMILDPAFFAVRPEPTPSEQVSHAG